MNKTVNINLGGLVFHIDEDAYQKLTNYFEHCLPTCEPIVILFPDLSSFKILTIDSSSKSS